MNNNLQDQLQNLVEQFVSTNPGLKEETQQRYQQSILKSISYLDKTLWKKDLPIKIQRCSIIRWFKRMKTSYSSGTIICRTIRVSNFFQFLESNGYLKENPLGLLEKKYPKKGLKAVIIALMEPSPQKSLKVLKALPRFASPLGTSMQNFIALGQSQGKSYEAEEQILCYFDRFLALYPGHPTHLSDSVIREWLNLFADKSQSHRYKMFGVIRHFCLYLRRFDTEVYVPGESLAPASPGPFVPHIYSKKQITTLLKTLRQSKPSREFPLRPQMLYILVLLLYTTGMRFSEALKLRLDDIDWKEEKLYIRQTKFFKSRIVPLSRSMTKKLKHYIQLREQTRLPTSPESFLFQNPYTHRPYLKSTIGKLFRRILRDLGLKSKQGHRGPRIHDLRHTFAVHRLEEWYRQGIDVQSKLGLLSTYLGHTGITGTQRYLTMTTELLQQASERFNQYFTSNPNQT